MGPRSYGRTKKGRWIVIRFYVSELKTPGDRRRTDERWFVVDMEDGGPRGIAKGTEEIGYGSKSDAIAVAREYRDSYGPYARFEF